MSRGTRFRPIVTNKGLEVDFYIDEGVSGRKVNRKGYNRFMEVIRAQMYSTAIVWKLDRASRRPYTGYRLKEALDATNTEFYSIVEGNMVNNRFMFGLWLLMAEEESRTKSVRARVGGFGRANKGKVTPVTRYGYRMNNEGTIDPATGDFVPGPNHGRPEIDEHEAEAVRRIFREYVDGVPMFKIIDGLERNGFQTRNGGEWSRYHTSTIIKSTEYIGYGYYGKCFCREGIGDTKHIEYRDEKEWVKIEYPPIVDESLWNQANTRKERNKRLMASKGYKLEFPLRGLTFCASCGRRFVGQGITSDKIYRHKDGTTVRKPRKPQRAYVCSKGRYKRSGCVRKSIGAVKLEKVVWEQVREIIENPQMVRDMMDDRRKQYEETGTYDELDAKRRKVEKSERERERVLMQHQKGHIDDDALDSRMLVINNEMRGIEQELARLEAEAENFEHQIIVLNDFVATTADISGRLDELTLKERAEVIQSVVSKITVGTDVDIEMALGAGCVRRPLEACHA